MLKKVSIITPSFNQCEYLEDAIKSVINQKNILIEHIIIDGGSSDNTTEILKKYDHLKWVSEKDRGQTHALNKALELTTGDIVGWLNADDYYEKNIFESIVNELEKKNINFVYGNFNYVNKSKEIIKKKKAKNVFFLSKKIISRFICFVPSVTFFINKNDLKNIKFDEKMEYTMDKDFFANLINNNLKPKKINLTISNFRLHGANKFEMKNDKISKNIRYCEGIQIFNKYTKYKIPNNLIGRLIYSSFQKIIMILNFISNFFIK
jgi:glycosyltransferase involved in cell wall biosynthesis